MGCHGSKDETPTCQAPRKMWRSFPPSTPSSAQRRLIEGLQDLKRQMDEESGEKESFSFTKIILKLGTIEKILQRINAVFKSVDHGNKGHVTKDELKEGLRRAHVDLGDEWEDTNIDDCLQHLQGRDDKVGLREFVVMLAVGRVCRPLKRRSSVFVPLQEEQEGGGATEGGLRMDDIVKKTIEEDEVRRWAQIPSLMSIDTSVRGLSRGLSRSGRSNSATGGRGGAGGNEVHVSMGVKYVLDLFIAAYFQFDKEGRGFITKSTIEKTLRKSENEPGVSGLLDKKRWSEAAWDGDRLSFQEFIYAFSLWLGLLEDDVDVDDDDKPYQHRSPQATPRAAAPVATAAAAAAAAAPAAAGEGDDGGGSS
ncbi:unnamed protein product [Ectocarpus sp. 6 AP-2014]